MSTLDIPNPSEINPITYDSGSSPRKGQYMTKIKRPDSTTIVISEEYHLIKNATELRNVLDAADIRLRDIPSKQRLIDDETFQPLMTFEVPDKRFGVSKYIVSMEHCQDLKALLQSEGTL
jgi:hypothetical protein